MNKLKEIFGNGTAEERRKQDKIDSKKTEPKVKYYLWDYCKSYGWRATGLLEGYSTLKELKEDSTYRSNKSEGEIMKILKATTLKGDEE